MYEQSIWFSGSSCYEQYIVKLHICFYKNYIICQKYIKMKKIDVIFVSEWSII